MWPVRRWRRRRCLRRNRVRLQLGVGWHRLRFPGMKRQPRRLSLSCLLEAPCSRPCWRPIRRLSFATCFQPRGCPHGFEGFCPWTKGCKCYARFLRFSRTGLLKTPLGRCRSVCCYQCTQPCSLLSHVSCIVSRVPPFSVLKCMLWLTSTQLHMLQFLSDS